MTHFKTALAAAVLALAACEGPAERAPAQPAASAAPTVEGAAVTDPRSVPPAFRAVWAASGCGADTLEIAADALTIGGNRAPVAEVVATGADEVRIAVTLPSGGQRTFRYRLVDGGAALFDVRSNLTRRRCPAA